MDRLLICLLILLPLICGSVTVKAQNPFLSPKSSQPVLQKSASQSLFLSKITLWQLQLKEKMTVLVRRAKANDSITPWLVVLMIAFGYGALHAAGPGHGKAVAISFISSRNASLGSGLLFGTLIAFCHGFSGIICVLGLYYFLKGGISGTLGAVSHITLLSGTSIYLPSCEPPMNNIHAPPRLFVSVTGLSISQHPQGYDLGGWGGVAARGIS